jgi:hypothetical protein
MAASGADKEIFNAGADKADFADYANAADVQDKKKPVVPKVEVKP